MDNLNDLYMYAMVVEHGGFSKAERALGIPKSRLSRRITELEADLGVRLLQRGSRHFVVTDVGQRVYQHVQSMLTEAQAARDVVAELQVEPRGVLRVSLPVDIAEQQMPRILPEFMKLYPQIQLQLSVTNRRIDLLNEGIDVALRVRDSLDNDGNLVMRNFGQTTAVLVASPDYLDRKGRPQHPNELIQHQTLSSNEREIVLPNWRVPQGIYHAVFASRRGILPAVRVFIDFLAEKIPPMLQELESKCDEHDQMNHVITN